MSEVSNVDAAINKSFNDLIYRLTGTNDLSTIKQIAPSVKLKKDFLVSYEPINFNEKSFLVTRFNKTSLLGKLDSLKIPIIGYNRPTIMLLVKVEDGNDAPYILNNSSSKLIDHDIKLILDEVSNQRGIFFELPVFDLDDIKELSSLTIFDSEEDIILSNYEYDYQLNLNISQSYINKWVITGDINSDKATSLKLTLSTLRKKLNTLANDYLYAFKIPNSQSSIRVIVNNINSYNELKQLQEAMSRLISIKTTKINSYVDTSVVYTLQISGDTESFKKEVNANPYLQLIESDDNVTFVLLNN
tara:strand:- start:12490 stop:13395 length:906 start_codon:yes stop_codon:yes gene_type:complete